MRRLKKADFDTGEETRPFAKLYKELFEIEALTPDAILVYTLLRDRCNLSAINNWIDSYGNVYMVFTNKELCKLTRRSNHKVSDTMKLLKEQQLIEVIRHPITQANIIYITDKI